jgi:hypothetical protein
VKRIRLLVVLGALALAVPFGLTAAHATGGGGSGSQNSISIDPYADYDFEGSQVDLKLYVKCTGGSAVDVELKQSQPETGSPVVVGIGSNPLVVCDGQTHSVGVTVTGVGYDTGWATAKATLLGVPAGNTKATATRQVYITQV